MVTVSNILKSCAALGLLLLTLAAIAACGGAPTEPQQSPVDIAGHSTDQTRPALSFAYRSDGDHMTNTGEFVKVKYGGGSSARLGQFEYALVEAHVHNPSEHTVDGQSFVLEMHLVHKRTSGEIAVVGVLYRLGEANPAIQAMIDAAPRQGETIELASPLTTADYLPESHGYYAYTGSLTTPPYTEGVEWLVMSQVGEVSQEQVTQMAALTGGGTNNRPVQTAGRAADNGLRGVLTGAARVCAVYFLRFSNRPTKASSVLSGMGILASAIESGKTIPPEKTSFMAASTVRSVSMTSSSTTKAKFPDVGFGTVGMYTITMVVSPSPARTWPVTNPSAIIPSLGHSTKTTRLKSYCEVSDLVACCVTP